MTGGQHEPRMLTRRALLAESGAALLGLAACAQQTGADDVLAGGTAQQPESLFGGESPSSPRDAGDPMQVVCFGDSITFGYGVDSQDQAWPALLEAKLPEGSSVTNYGRNGARLSSNSPYSYQATGDIDKGILARPDAFTLMLGTNDAVMVSFDSVLYDSELRAIITELMGLSWEPRVLLMVPPPIFAHKKSFLGADAETTLKERVTPCILRVAEQTGCLLLNLREYCADHADWFPDGVHPNEEGNKAIAEAVYETIAI